MRSPLSPPLDMPRCSLGGVGCRQGAQEGLWAQDGVGVIPSPGWGAEEQPCSHLGGEPSLTKTSQTPSPCAHPSCSWSLAGVGTGSELVDKCPWLPRGVRSCLSKFAGGRICCRPVPSGFSSPRRVHVLPSGSSPLCLSASLRSLLSVCLLLHVSLCLVYPLE